MTFASPWVLLALVALPLLAVAYVSRVRGAGAASAAFATAPMRASVQPRPPRWRSHLPVIVMLIAGAALILAAAKPQRSVAVPIEQASIMLATDVSGSMQATDVAPDRLTAAKRAAHTFLDSVPEKVRVGVMSFNQTPTILQSPTTDRRAASEAIDQQTIYGTTATGDAITQALKSLENVPSDTGSPPPAAILLLSDGKSTRGSDPVDAAKKAGDAKVPVYTVALGTPTGTITTKKADGSTRVTHVPPDPTTLEAIAKASGGQSFTVGDASKLNQIYERLGSQLSHETQKQQMTAWFAGAGLLLLLGAGAMSLGWFGRLA